MAAEPILVVRGIVLPKELTAAIDARGDKGGDWGEGFGARSLHGGERAVFGVAPHRRHLTGCLRCSLERMWSYVACL